eukprot:987175-Rhodomonas_salina.2
MFAVRLSALTRRVRRVRSSRVSDGTQKLGSKVEEIGGTHSVLSCIPARLLRSCRVLSVVVAVSRQARRAS